MTTTADLNRAYDIACWDLAAAVSAQWPDIRLPELVEPHVEAYRAALAAIRESIASRS